MANETVITIVGNLTADPEIRVTPSGVALARFTVASTPRHFDKASGKWGDGESMFLTCSAWRDLAEHIVESLTKGMKVIVTGRLRQHHWKDEKSGENRSMFGLDVEDIGPSLRHATATVRKVTRAANQTPPDDPWAVATPAKAGANAGSGFGPEPPF